LEVGGLELLAEMNFTREIVLAIEETLKGQVVVVELFPLLLRSFLHVLDHLVDFFLAFSNLEKTVLILRFQSFKLSLNLWVLWGSKLLFLELLKFEEVTLE